LDRVKVRLQNAVPRKALQDASSRCEMQWCELRELEEKDLG